MTEPIAVQSRTYEIHEVAELTGLAPERLRVWERRYAVVRPVRQANGYRSYTAEQVALLRTLARRVARGERIGDLVSRPVDELLADAPGESAEAPTPLAALVDAVAALDRERLEALVAQQLALLGVQAFARDVVLPLALRIGDLWALGRIPVAAEHMASEVVVPALKAGLRGTRGRGALVLAACVPGERHEWGVLATLAGAQGGGTRVEYLGPDLPLADAVESAWRLRPARLALSVSLPALVEASLPELADLPGKLPPETRAVVGGGGVEPYARILERGGWLLGEDALRAVEGA